MQRNVLSGSDPEYIYYEIINIKQQSGKNMGKNNNAAFLI
jgi:hypothetical protein